MDRRGSRSFEGEVLDIPAIRTLAPIFPGPFGFGTGGPFTTPNPFGNTTPVFTPVFPTAAPFTHSTPPPQPPPPPNANAVPVTVIVDSDGEENEDASNGAGAYSTPVSDKKGGGSSGVLRRKMSARKTVMGRTPSQSQNGSSSGKRKERVVPKVTEDLGALIVLPPLLLLDNDAESVGKMLMAYDGLRRKLSQLDDANMAAGAASCRPSSKACSILMSRGVRVNAAKRLGAIRGVDIGEIFYFRFEMCLIGLHAQSMGGIDTMTARFGNSEDQVAASIVSAGVYEDDINRSDVLIYTGSGGITSSGKHTEDQKMERGNLALNKSLQYGNEIRVIYGVKDPGNVYGRVYIYDGIYKVQEFWTEKVEGGFNVFKFKLQRVEGQPEGIDRWKHIQQWKQDASTRPGVITCDISSAVEKIPVALVNEVDSERVLAPFTYATRVKYLQPPQAVKPLLGCQCADACSSASKCSCKEINGGALPITSTGQLVVSKPMIYECSSCRCSLNCKNRMSQKGISFRFEVFRTKNKGWGLRSWDRIRSGSFICEFVGEVSSSVEFFDSDDNNDYVFDGATTSSGESSFDWNSKITLKDEQSASVSDGPSTPLTVAINGKRMGNISRFINHSCSPNIVWQPVLYDHSDECFPHIAFYALRHIPPLTELTYDYGNKSGNAAPKKCFCGSSKCRGYFS